MPTVIPSLTVRTLFVSALVGLASIATVATQSKPAAPAPAAPTAPDLNLDYERFTLSNGLRVIVHQDRKAPVVAVSIWYHVGSKNEPQGKTGFAHLFEHLMFNGIGELRRRMVRTDAAQSAPPA